MLTKTRVTTIVNLAFPISIALGSTLMMSVIDLAMVGRLGSAAIAAVGLSVFCNTLVLALVAGIAPAVQGLVARRRGENSSQQTSLPFNAGALLALVVGAPLTVGAFFLSPYLFSAISSDPAVTRIGIPFLRTLYLGIIAVGVGNAFKGYWAGMEKPKVYMLIVLFMNCLNAGLNYVLIFGHLGVPAMGATGAAVGTVVSLYAGMIVSFAVSRSYFRNEGFLVGRPSRASMVQIFKIGLPATMQEFFFSAGYVVFFWMIGMVGTAELAATNVLVRVAMVLTLLAMSLGMASATLVSKTVGEGDLAGAAQWGWDTGKVGVIGITLLGLPLFFFPGPFLSIFLSDPHALSIAILPMRLLAATTGIGSLIYIFAYTLYSVGDGKRVIMVSLGTQWLLFLPGVWIVGPYLRCSLLQIWFVQMAYGVLATVLITSIWADGKWKSIRI
jgi:putative MATE family efflux protein